MTAPRPIPTTFLNRSTYGINTNANNDRLPKIPDNAVGSLTSVLVGTDLAPSRIALAGLQVANEESDIIKLCIGAMLDSSGTSATAAKLTSPWSKKYVDGLFEWCSSRATARTRAVVVTEEGQSAAGTAEQSFPTENLPEWIKELEIEDADMEEAFLTPPNEIAAYAGIIAYAIAKQPTAANLEAFNQKRRSAISQYIASGKVTIFVDDSKYLSLEVLGKIHRSFNSAILDRALTMSAIVDHDHDLISGLQLMFYIIFRLTSGTALNPLLLIVKYASKYGSFYHQFRELETEYHAAAHALSKFYETPEKRRLYLKVIFGSAYSPVDRGDINELLGCAVFALKQNETTLENYNGGTLSAANRQKLSDLLGVRPAADDEVPEE